MTGRRRDRRLDGLACFGLALAWLMWGLAPLPLRAADDVDPPITLEADWSQEWTEGNHYIGLFRGHCQIDQGDERYSARSMVVWVHETSGETGPQTHLTVYLEDDVRVVTAAGVRHEPAFGVMLQTEAGVQLDARSQVKDRPAREEPLFERASRYRETMEPTRFIQTQLTIDPSQPGSSPLPENIYLPAPANNVRRVRVYPRSSQPYTVDSRQLTNTTPPEQVVVVTGGVNLLIDGIDEELQETTRERLRAMNLGPIGTVDLSADRVVIWTTATPDSDFSPEFVQDRNMPFQVYLEGNIVVRQGNSVVRADRAFFDARENRAMILNAELRTYLPEFGATVRVRAERLRQLSFERYHAQNAWFTTSTFGKPGYRLQAGDVFIEQRDWSPTVAQEPRIDAATGEPLPPQGHLWVTANNTQFLLGDVPVFYSPYFSAPAEDPGIPIRGVSFGQDRIFGTQIRTKWDAFGLFGMDRPADVKWNLLADYLSKRGPAIGTDGSYRGVDAYGNTFIGSGLAYYIYDDGVDTLGFDRRSINPEDPNRGRISLQHRHFLPFNTVFQGEIGYASDRNFNEQYFENDFDTKKDQETLGYLKQNFAENWSWSLLLRPQVNDFENNTAWLPKGDLFAIGQPLWNTPINWSMHSSIGYANSYAANPPSDPNDLFTPLPYYTDASGLVAMSRHEVEAPFDLGPLNVTPYALGEAAFWGDGFTNDSVDRLYGRGGVRASILFWKSMPEVQSAIFDLNGLAHKMTFDLDYSYSASSRDISEIPQFNEFDDDAQERFRQRFAVNTFGGTLPSELESRFYAVRTGAGSSVTAPYHELVDDQQVLRLGWNHRLQTRAGPPDRQRIRDWMTLNMGISYFPEANRDNFGEDFGLFSTRYNWNIGDRTSIVASSLVDFFDGGQQVWNVGLLTQRSLRGNLYLGLRQIKAGDLDSQILTASSSYVLSPKWVATAATAFDLAEARNSGQSFTITRVGADFLVHVGLNYDAGKNNVGATLSIEPRFGSGDVSSPQLGSLIGQRPN